MPRLRAFCCFAIALFGSGAAWAASAAQFTNVNAESFAGPGLTVVTFNMLHGFGNRLNDTTLEERLSLLAESIQEAKPDFVILQEASETPGRHGNVVTRLRDTLNEKLRGTGVSYNSAHAMANGSRLIGFFEGSGILSRYEILSADCLEYRAQAIIPPEQRIALRLRIMSGTGTVEIVGTHLTNTEARGGGRLKRSLQAEELVSWLRGFGPAEAIIVGGDFNDGPDSATVRTILDAGGHDAWDVPGTQGPGFTALDGTVRDADDRADQRIDYLFVFGDRVAIRGAVPFLDRPGRGIDGRPLWASDHVGVMAAMVIGPSYTFSNTIR